MEELEPCPFCGGEAALETRSWNYDGTSHVRAYCADMSCAVNGPWRYTEEEAIAAWNTRAEWMCHMKRRPGTINGSIGYLTCSFCNCGFDYTEEPFHCMNCGAKVIDDD